MGPWRGTWTVTASIGIGSVGLWFSKMMVTRVHDAHIDSRMVKINYDIEEAKDLLLHSLRP